MNTHCLDVYTGYRPDDRERLIQYLKNTASTFGITKVQRGRMKGEYSLRIQTENAEALQKHIHSGAGCAGDAGINFGDDCDYTVYYNHVDAGRDMRFMPDYNNPLGDKEFELFPPEKTAA